MDSGFIVMLFQTYTVRGVKVMWLTLIWKWLDVDSMIGEHCLPTLKGMSHHVKEIPWSANVNISWGRKSELQGQQLIISETRLEVTGISCRCLGFRKCWRDERSMCWLQVSSYDQLFFLSSHKTTSLVCCKGCGWEVGAKELFMFDFT